MTGDINRLVGKPTAKPMSQARANLSRKPVFQPVIIEVMVKDIVVSRAKVINKPVRISEYFLVSFKADDHI